VVCKVVADLVRVLIDGMLHLYVDIRKLSNTEVCNQIKHRKWEKQNWYIGTHFDHSKAPSIYIYI